MRPEVLDVIIVNPGVYRTRISDQGRANLLKVSGGLSYYTLGTTLSPLLMLFQLVMS
jgi:hypothetical protein